MNPAALLRLGSGIFHICRLILGNLCRNLGGDGGGEPVRYLVYLLLELVRQRLACKYLAE